MLPEIARLAPELAASLAEEHPELERAAIAIDSLWPRFAPLGPEERQAMGGELRGVSRRWSRCSCGTWTARSARSTPCSGRTSTDRDIGALSRRIVVSIPPARLLHWQQQVLLPAWSAPEIAARPPPAVTV